MPGDRGLQAPLTGQVKGHKIWSLKTTRDYNFTKIVIFQELKGGKTNTYTHAYPIAHSHLHINLDGSQIIN